MPLTSEFADQCTPTNAALSPELADWHDVKHSRYQDYRCAAHYRNLPSMIISKKNRRAIYENLFKEGVLVAKKDYNAPKHEELDVPNLEVIKAMQSLTSKGLVKTQFSWQYYYYVLTQEGVDYLRAWLHLPDEIVPTTHKRAARPPRPAVVRQGGEGGAYRPPRGGDREDYRRKEGGAPSEFRPQFADAGRGASRE